MRIYERNGKRYLSVTSILDLMYPFDREGWMLRNGYTKEYADYILKESSRGGSLVHSWVEDEVLGVPSCLRAEPQKHKEQVYLRAVKDWCKSHNLKTDVQSEFEVFCDNPEYAGRVDLKIGDTLFDFKAFGFWSNWYSYNADKIKKVRIQLSMYSHALGGGHRLVVVLFKPDGTFEEKELKFTDRWIKWMESNQDLILETIKETHI